MSIVRKPVVSFHRADKTNILNIKYILWSIAFLSLLATVLAIYFINIARIDIHHWLAKNDNSYHAHFLQVTIDKTWAELDDDIQVGQRLLTISFDQDSERGIEFAQYLLATTREKIDQCRIKISTLKQKHQSNMFALMRQQVEVNKRIIDIQHYDKLPEQLLDDTLDRVSLLAKLKHERQLIVNKVNEQPLKFEQEMYELVLLMNSLTYQLDNISSNHRFDLIAQQVGSVYDIHINKGDTIINTNTPLVTLYDKANASYQDVFIASRTNKPLTRSVDNRLKRNAFRYIKD